MGRILKKFNGQVLLLHIILCILSCLQFTSGYQGLKSLTLLYKWKP